MAAGDTGRKIACEIDAELRLKNMQIVKTR